MRWTPGWKDEDVEDRRGSGGGGFRGMGLGGGGGMRMGLGGMLVLLVLSFIFKVDFLSMFMGGGGGSYAPTETSRPAGDVAEQTESAKFAMTLMTNINNTWEQIMAESGNQFSRTQIVLFRDTDRSACGLAQAATGPFYCPGDRKVYIDLGFFDELSQRFRAPGDFAKAYVLAHEVGHHIQTISGIETKVRQLQSRNPGQKNALSVRMELQADCLAGVWGARTKGGNVEIEPGDLEEGMRAAAAIGDDRIQRMSGRAASPDSFTHGSSAQRVEWLKRGFQEGKVSACNTFDSGAVN